MVSAAVVRDPLAVKEQYESLPALLTHIARSEFVHIRDYVSVCAVAYLPIVSASTPSCLHHVADGLPAQRAEGRLEAAHAHE